MKFYAIKDVERVLRLSRATVRALVKAGFVTPARGPRNAWQFSFQDLIVLRSAQALVRADVPARRIMRALRELRATLPESMPLSGLAIGAVGDRVVVREGAGRWQAEDGQYVLELESDAATGSLRIVEGAGAARASAPSSLPGTTVPGAAGADWYARGADLEERDTGAAIAAYEKALAADPTLLDASINLGRLLHDRGDLARAEAVYVAAVTHNGDDAVLWFNLGVLLEDMGKADGARDAYEAAVRSDADFADGHYNLALLFEKMKRPKDALRHMARYRILVGRGR